MWGGLTCTCAQRYLTPHPSHPIALFVRMPLLLLQSPPHTPLPSPLHCCCHPRYQVPARLPSHWVSRASFETLQRPSVDGSGNSARQLGRPPRLLSTTSLPTLKTQQLHSLQPLTPVPERYDPALGRASPGPRSQASAIMRGKVARRSATSSAVGGSGSSGGGGGGQHKELDIL